MIVLKPNKTWVVFFMPTLNERGSCYSQRWLKTANQVGKIPFNEICCNEPAFFHFWIIQRPALTNPELLYRVPRCGPILITKVRGGAAIFTTSKSTVTVFFVLYFYHENCEFDSNIEFHVCIFVIETVLMPIVKILLVN